MKYLGFPLRAARGWWHGRRRTSGVQHPAEGTPAGTSASAKGAPSRGPDRAGGSRIPSVHSFRVLFVIRPGVWDAACMRIPGYNIIEALRLAGIEVAHLDDRHIPSAWPRPSPMT